MRFGSVPVEDAQGAVLAHKLVDQQGRKLFSKGHVLSNADLEVLRKAGLRDVIVARLAPSDLDENTAARRVAEAIIGEGVNIRASGVGRANIMADTFGPLRLNVPVLEKLNNINESITIATLRQHTLVEPRELVSLVKIIPFGVEEEPVRSLECKARELGPVIEVRPMRSLDVALIISGPESMHEKLTADFLEPVRQRIERLGSHLLKPVLVLHEPAPIAAAIQQMSNQAGLILTAGISAIIDRGDVVPVAVNRAGGHVVHFGVPVDPGSLLMLGYIGDVPVIGAPGCVKSPKTNVIDMLLPRLLAGERLTRADLVALGHGGLLEDISERPMPRSP